MKITFSPFDSDVSTSGASGGILPTLGGGSETEIRPFSLCPVLALTLVVSVWSTAAEDLIAESRARLDTRCMILSTRIRLLRAACSLAARLSVSRECCTGLCKCGCMDLCSLSPVTSLDGISIVRCTVPTFFLSCADSSMFSPACKRGFRTVFSSEYWRKVEVNFGLQVCK